MAKKLRDAVKAYAHNPAIGLGSAVTKSTAPKKGLAPVKGLKPQVPIGPGTPPPVTPAVTPPAGSAVSAPMPWDKTYEDTIGGINRDLTSTLAGLTNEESGVKQAYGFDDLSDPFSRLALLKETFANSKAADKSSYAAQGQGYSGAYGSQQNATQHGYDVSYDTTRRDYQSALDSIAARRTAAKNQAGDAEIAAEGARTQAALDNRPDPATVPAVPPAPPSAPAAPKPYTEKAGKNSKGQSGVWHIYPDGRKVFVRK